MPKTVLEKLGWKVGLSGWAHHRPASLADAIPFATKAPTRRPDVIIAFVQRVADVPAVLQAVSPHYERGRSLWLAYPKKPGTIQTDISRDLGWQPLADLDLLPVTQVALDGTWSALRFRYRDEIPTLTRKSALPGKK